VPLTAYKASIFCDATSILVFRGPPNVAVAWEIASGPGTIEGLSNSTDLNGVACAIYRADGSAGQAVCRVSHGS
jgi:hypothetical protein